MILVELIFNSIKYAFPGSKKGVINIELKRINSKIILIVADNGIGLRIIFDTIELKSTGLSLVESMVNSLKGNMKFIKDNGTKIIIELFLPEIIKRE